MILDVVYNHIGPGSEAIAAFGPYFTDRHDTFWGAALDYAQRGVREWAIQNAELWTRDYQIDGLRLDAVHAIYDDAKPHVLTELQQRVDGFVISEMNTEDLRPLDEWGHDAMWLDSLHHELHVLLTGETDGYFADFGTVDGLVRELRSATVRSASSWPLRTTTRSATAPSATASRGTRTALRSPASSSRSRRRSSSWARSTTSSVRSSSSPITSTPRSPRRRARGGVRRSNAPPVPAARRRIRRRSRRSSARSVEPREPDPLFTELLALRRTLPRELDIHVDGQTRDA